MVWLALFLVLVIAVLVGCLVWQVSEPPEPPDPEAAVRAAIELQAIRRRLDADWTKTEQRRDASRLRRQIAKALDEADDGP